MSSYYAQKDNIKDRRTLYCGNLHENVTEELLFELFLQSGPLEEVRLKRDGRKAFAFITFKHEESVPYAEAIMENIHLFKRELRLNPRTNANNSNNISNPNNSYADMNSPQIGHLQQHQSLSLMGSPFRLPPANDFDFNVKGHQANFSDVMPSHIQHQQVLLSNPSAITNYKLSQDNNDESRHSSLRQSRRDNRSYHPYHQRQQSHLKDSSSFSHSSKNQRGSYSSFRDENYLNNRRHNSHAHNHR